VMEKTQDIAILKSFGASRRTIRRIFLFEGAFIGLIGTLLGNILAIILLFIGGKTNLVNLPPDVYYLSKIPIKYDITIFATVSLVCFLTCWLVTVYPANRASKINIIEAMRNG